MAPLIRGVSDDHLFGTSMPGAGAIHPISLRMLRMVDSADKQVAHGEVDHGFGDVEAPLVVAHEATVACQPTEAALDDPPARQYFEAGLGIEATDDLDDEVEIGRFVEELAPIVGAIGEQMLDPGPTLTDGVEDRLRAGAVRDLSLIHI